MIRRTTESAMRLIHQARDALLEAARAHSWLKRSEALQQADRQLAKVERALQPLRE